MIQLMSEGDISMAPEEIEIGKKLYGVMSDPKNSALKASILDVIQAGGRPSMEALSKIPGLTPRDEAYLVGLNARALSDVTVANPKLMTAQAAMDRNTIYSQKIAIGESIKSIDAEMNRMTSEFPALRKIPTIDVDLLRAPSQPSAPAAGKNPVLPAPGKIPGVVVPGAPNPVGASAVPTAPEMFGPPSPRDAFVQEGIRLGKLAARGGVNTSDLRQISPLRSTRTSHRRLESCRSRSVQASSRSVRAA